MKLANQDKLNTLFFIDFDIHADIGRPG